MDDFFHGLLAILGGPRGVCGDNTTVCRGNVREQLRFYP